MTPFRSLPPPALRPGYYLDNFEVLLRQVAERDRDLLEAGERRFLVEFPALGLDARRLYVRLLGRRGPAIRQDRLRYPEIDCAAALVELMPTGFADRAEDVAASELLRLLRQPELAALAVARLGGGRPRGSAKPELMAALAAAVPEPELRREVDAIASPVRPLRLLEVRVFRLLFFGNLGQDLSEFVLRDLGLVRFESYELGPATRPLAERRAVDDTLALADAGEVVADRLAAADLDGAAALAAEVASRRWHPAAERRRDRLLLAVAQALERAGRVSAALALYAGCAAPPARERRVRILLRWCQIAEARALLAEITAAPRDEAERVFAAAAAERLRRCRHPASRVAARRPARPEFVLRVAPRPEETVEALALAALAERGRQGCFAENWLWRALFGLAFWDVVFAPVPGAFAHPFQYGPLDLHGAEFRRNREASIASRLEELAAAGAAGGSAGRSNGLAERLLAVYDSKLGVANALVSWHEGARASLELVLSRLAGAQLAAVCERLSRDLGRYRRGLPDLFVADDSAAGFCLYEVKGPQDALRPEQAAWLDYLSERGLPAAVLRLRWD